MEGVPVHGTTRNTREQAADIACRAELGVPVRLGWLGSRREAIRTCFAYTIALLKRSHAVRIQTRTELVVVPFAGRNFIPDAPSFVLFHLICVR